MPQNRRIRMPSVGDVVQSIKGRDRYRVFLVVDMDESDKVSPVVIADGDSTSWMRKSTKIRAI